VCVSWEIPQSGKDLTHRKIDLNGKTGSDCDTDTDTEDCRTEEETSMCYTTPLALVETIICTTTPVVIPIITAAPKVSPVPKVSPSSKAAVFKGDASKRDVKLSAVVWTVRIDIVVCPISLYRCKLVR